ncbi:MAG: glycosyltransferase family 4 protein [Nanoarchaeota archaeon]|nr:glycosyltransferase family 4 protein [Nanoarchaeota archaeon]
MKKKLLIATDSFIPRWDGIAQFLSEIIPRLAEDYNITVIAPDFKGEQKHIEHVRIVRIPLSMWSFGDYTLAKLKRKKIRELVKESDMVWVQSIGPIGGAAIYYAKKAGIPIAYFVNSIEWELVSMSISRPYLSFIITQFVKAVAKWLYRKTNLLITPSKEVVRIFDNECITVPKKVVYLGTDTSRFRPPENKDEAKKRVGIDPEYTVIGYHGRIAREKNLMTLYYAFLKLQKKHPKTKLLIVGSGIPKMEALFRSAVGIKYIESKDDVIPYLQAMDIYVLPSLTETTSLSTLEAMSCGCAVISTKVGLVKRYIKDKVNGSFFPKGNATALKIKLNWLIENPGIRAKLGRNARETVKAKFNWEKTETGIREALEDL